jgi:hypothetical protein
MKRNALFRFNRVTLALLKSMVITTNLETYRISPHSEQPV